MKNLNNKKDLKFKEKNEGITLIALIVTIIIVLILASVSVAVFSKTGIIKKSKLAGKNYQNKINEEEKAMQNYASTMNEYSIADAGRDETITISKDEYENLKLINKPNLWEVGKEYDFGDGIYGQRFKGVPVSKQASYDIINIDYIVNYGGYGKDNESHKFQLGFNNNAVESIETQTNSIFSNDSGIQFRFGSTITDFDIWALYTKK